MPLVAALLLGRRQQRPIAALAFLDVPAVERVMAVVASTAPVLARNAGRRLLDALTVILGLAVEAAQILVVQTKAVGDARRLNRPAVTLA